MSQITNTGNLQTLTGSGGGGAVSPLNGNITIVGGTGIAVTGNQAAHTITISNTGAEASTFNGDIGTATPLAGVVNIVGDPLGSIETAAAGNTIEIAVVGTVAEAVQIGNNNGSLSNTNVGTNGQLLIGNSFGSPGFNSLTSTSGTVSFTAGANTLDLNVAGGGLTWQTVAVDTPMQNNRGYVVNSNGGTITMTLPVTSAIGSTIKIVDIGVLDFAWIIAQNAGQSIFSANEFATTNGVAGSLRPGIVDTANDVNSAAITIVCAIANTLWIVESANCLLETT